MLAAGCVGGSDDREPPDVASLVREGARPTLVRRADLDGDGTAEIAVVSVSRTGGTFGLPTPYLEVFAYRDGDWRRLLDATTDAPPGRGVPETMLQPQDEAVAAGQAVELLEPADLERDGSAELVVAVSNAGATVGPLELWILSMAGERFRTEYFTRTERGGDVVVGDGRVTLELGIYRRGDPGCCPSILERRTIGAEAGRIGVIERTRRRTRTG